MAPTASAAFMEYAEAVRPRIDASLQACITSLGEGCPPRLRKAIEYSLLAPGKRLRPMLVLMATQACGGQEKKAMPATCAVEMVHAYSLIHDDLPAMDDDDLRRGRPTCHKVFGEALAILTGDALLTLAFESLTTLDAPPGVIVACCRALAEAAGACQLVGGQADDIEEGGDQAEGLTDQERLFRLEAIHRRKTGAMIRVSLRLGGLVARAQEAQLLALEEYGRRIGLAFQITDDLLDVRGDEASVGKRLGKDSDRGKLTFPGLLGVDPSMVRAQELIDEACDALTGLRSAGKRNGPVFADAKGGTTPLEMLARYILERNR